MYTYWIRLILCASIFPGVLPSNAQSRGRKGYVLVWADEFNKSGPPNPANWQFEHGHVRNHEAQWYQQENAYCKDGLLVIEGRHEYDPGKPYTSSSINTSGRRSWRYGRFEMRARIDIASGMWPAWWMMADSLPWPANGEIDIMEYYQNQLLANVACQGVGNQAEWHSSIHRVDSMGGEGWASQFHIWRMDWDSAAIALYVDDVLLNRVEVAAVVNKDASGVNAFHRPHFMLLNLAMGGDNGGVIRPDTKWPRIFEVDWVRVYRRRNYM